jgi:hypothetical protein
LGVRDATAEELTPLQQCESCGTGESCET